MNDQLRAQIGKHTFDDQTLHLFICLNINSALLKFHKYAGPTLGQRTALGGCYATLCTLRALIKLESVLKQPSTHRWLEHIVGYIHECAGVFP